MIAAGVGIEAQRFLNGAQGVVRAVVVQQDQRADVVGEGVFRGQADGGAGFTERVGVAILVVEGQCQERMRIGVIRRGGERLAQRGLGVFLAPGLEEKVGFNQVFLHTEYFLSADLAD